MKKAVSVDEYIENAPKDVQGRLNQIRSAIKEVAPNAQEKISYGMPYYSYKGRLVYFAYAKNHIGLYPMPPIIEENLKELKKYQTAKATIRFPLNEDLPIPLIKRLVKAVAERNEKEKGQK